MWGGDGNSSHDDVDARKAALQMELNAAVALEEHEQVKRENAELRWRISRLERQLEQANAKLARESEQTEEREALKKQSEVEMKQLKQQDEATMASLEVSKRNETSVAALIAEKEKLAEELERVKEEHADSLAIRKVAEVTVKECDLYYDPVGAIEERIRKEMGGDRITSANLETLLSHCLYYIPTIYRNKQNKYCEALVKRCVWKMQHGLPDMPDAKKFELSLQYGLSSDLNAHFISKCTPETLDDYKKAVDKMERGGYPIKPEQKLSSAEATALKVQLMNVADRR